MEDKRKERDEKCESAREREREKERERKREKREESMCMRLLHVYV